MSTTELDPSLRQGSGALVLHDAIKEPVFREIAEELDLLVGSACEQLDQIIDDHIVPETEVMVDQQTVDRFVDSFWGERASQARSVARTFKELDKPTFIKDADNVTSFVDGVIAEALFIEQPNSRQLRRTKTGKIASQAKEIAAFWDESIMHLPNAPGEYLKQNVEKLDSFITPVRQATVKPKDTEGVENTLEILSRAEQIEEGLDLSGLKFVVATELFHLMATAPLSVCTRTVYNSSNNKSGMTETYAKLENANLIDAYATAELISDLSLDTEEANKTLRLYHLHPSSYKGRLFRRSDKSYMDSYDKLRASSEIYMGVLDAEDTVSRLPEIKRSSFALIAALKNVEVAKFMAEFGKDFPALHKKMVDSANQLIHDNEGDPEAQSEVWQNACAFDDLFIARAAEMERLVMNSGAEVTDEDQALFKNWQSRLVRGQLERNMLNEQLHILSAEIQTRLTEFNAIDNQYALSNNQLRKRHPRLIQIAHQLANSISGHEPLGEDQSRALVGLMLGVYGEQAGKPVDHEALVENYLADAGRLRELGLDLEFLGQPQRSKLLDMLNLLDELIDSGVFDKNDNPALSELDDFVLAYLIATAPEVAPVTPPVERPIDVPDVPVETLTQADYEDIKVFPPGASEKDIIRDYVKGVTRDQLPSIEWERIRRMIELRDKFVSQQLDVQFIRTKHASWQVLPFFILEVKIPQMDHAVAIVESPVYGNATYIYREASNRPTWREVVQKKREEARSDGAVPMVHVDGTRLDNHFIKVWNRVISELTIKR